jgi:hypothetical protein
MRCLGVALTLTTGVIACDRAQPATAASAPDAAASSGAVIPARVVDATAPPSDVAPASDAAVTPAVATTHRPEPIGGTWVTCYGRFRPTSTPERDVLRLGLLCGPANGMKQLGPVLQGDATDGGAEHVFDAKAGECFRLFAVGDAGVANLGLELRDPKGMPIGADHGDDRWPVVNSDGPVCVMDDGRYTVRVRARKGAGRYALTIWKLPAAS